MSELFTYNVDFQTFLGKIYRLEEYLKVYSGKDEHSILDYVELFVDDGAKTLTLSHRYGNDINPKDIIVFTESDLNSTVRIGLVILGFANVAKNVGSVGVERFTDIVPKSVYRSTNSFDGIFTSWNDEDEKAHQDYLSRKA